MNTPTVKNSSNVATACSEAELPVFDYSGLDDRTVEYLHLAEQEYAQGKVWAERGLRRMADGVAIAHEALCEGVVPNWDNSKHGNRGEDSFRSWCASIGVSKSAAYRLLQVSNLYDQSSPKQQEVLEQLAPSLLYAAAKPSAPAELRQGVQNGDITTHKQYRQLLAAYNDAEEKAKEAQAREEEARQKATDAEQQVADQAARIKELEARPVEVVGASAADIATWRAEGAATARKDLQALQRQLQKAQREAQEQRKRAEIAEEDAEQAGQESLEHASELAQARSALEQAQAKMNSEQPEAVSMARQAAAACEALLKPRIEEIITLSGEQYTEAHDQLVRLCDRLRWALENDAWPGENWPEDEDDPWEDDEWEDEEE